MPILKIREAPSGRGLPRKRVGEPYGINDLSEENNCAFFKKVKMTSSKIASSRMLLSSAFGSHLPPGGRLGFAEILIPRQTPI